jgi:hypothetical protein
LPAHLRIRRERIPGRQRIKTAAHFMQHSVNGAVCAMCDDWRLETGDHLRRRASYGLKLGLVVLWI